MARQLKVFAVSLLLACFFAFPAHAEWSFTDSNNLSSIKSYTQNIQSYTSTIQSYLSTTNNYLSWINGNVSSLPSILSDTGYINGYMQTISNLMTNNVSGWYQFFVKLTSIDNKLSTVNSNLDSLEGKQDTTNNNLDSLEGKQDTTNNNLVDINDTATVNGETLTDIYSLLEDRLESGARPDYSQTYLAFDTTFCDSRSIDESFPFMVISNNNYCNFYFNGQPYINILESGSYSLICNVSSNASGGNISFNSLSGSNLSILRFDSASYSNVSNTGIYRYYFNFSVKEDLPFIIYINVPSLSSYFSSIYIYRLDDGQDELASSLEPSFSDKQSNLDDGIDQLESQEDSVFTSLDTSIGSLDFSGSALGQVVSGFTFIRAVFSAVYSSSPYISVLINLSCMLGVLALFLRVQPRFSRWEREHRDRDS